MFPTFLLDFVSHTNQEHKVKHIATLQQLCHTPSRLYTAQVQIPAYKALFLKFLGLVLTKNMFQCTRVYLNCFNAQFLGLVRIRNILQWPRFDTHFFVAHLLGDVLHRNKFQWNFHFSTVLPHIS